MLKDLYYSLEKAVLTNERKPIYVARVCYLPEVWTDPVKTTDLWIRAKNKAIARKIVELTEPLEILSIQIVRLPR